MMAAVQIQGLTASKFLPQLPQDEFFLGGWYAETPQKWMPEQGSTELLDSLFQLQRQFACAAPFDTAI